MNRAMYRTLPPWIACTTDPAGPAGGGLPTAPPPPAPAPPAPAGGLSQEQVNGLLARERAESERRAQRQFLESLGFADAAGLKAELDAAKQAREAGLTEQQKAVEAANAAKAAAEQAQAAATTATHQARVERHLYAAGLPPLGADGQPNPAVAMAARMVAADQAADDAAVRAAVDAVKAVVPALFTTAPPVTVPGSVPGQQPPLPPGSVTGGSLKEQAAAITKRLNEQTRGNGLLPSQAAGQ